MEEDNEINGIRHSQKEGIIIDTIEIKIGLIEGTSIHLLPNHAEMGTNVLIQIVDLFIQIKKDINQDKDAGITNNADSDFVDLVIVETETMN